MAYAPFSKEFAMTDFVWPWNEFYRDLGEDEDGKPVKEFGEIRRGEEIITPTVNEDGETENVTSFEQIWQPNEGPAIPLAKAGRVKKAVRSSVVRLTEGGLPCQQQKIRDLEKKIMASRDDETLSKLCEELALCPVLQNQPQYTQEIAARRLRRYYRKNMKRKLGWYSHNLFLIGKDGEKHASPEMVAAREGQLSRSNDWLSRTTAKTEFGEFNLLDLATKGKKQRYSETWCRLKGMEKLAREKSLIPIFYTFTCPPELHPNPKFGGDKWDGSLPDASVKFLSGAFATLRANLLKEEVILVGCRFPEAHEDGCAHAHGLFWAHPNDLDTVTSEVKKIWNWHEKAFKLKFLDNEPADKNLKKAAPSSYCMKYIAKTLNLRPGETDSHETWLSTWGGRAFDWFGLPPTGLWRALRAIKPDQIKAGDWRLSTLAHYAKEGDYYNFLKLAGGVGCKQKERPIRVEVYSETPDATHKTIQFKTPKPESIIALFLKPKASRETTPVWAIQSGEPVTLVPELPKKTKPNPQPTQEQIEFFVERLAIVQSDGTRRRKAMEIALLDHPRELWDALERMAA
jgi:hypothetical protein